ncbi:MAG: general stress protein [Candidatus Saccharibacteria bacterium]
MTTRPGRGWHGDSAGHAAAGRIGGQKSGGNFARDRVKASRAGSNSGGNFARDRKKASEAGKVGGQRSSRVPVAS